jgi:hypothetical protein
MKKGIASDDNQTCKEKLTGWQFIDGCWHYFSKLIDSIAYYEENPVRGSKPGVY